MDLLMNYYGCTNDLQRICYVFITDVLRLLYGFTTDLHGSAMDLLWIY